jgi:CspA family cold shock protein
MASLTFHKSASLGLSSLLPLARRVVVESPTDGFLAFAPRGAVLPGNSQRKIDMTTNQTGTVKWFNESKGYGFIAPDDGSKDLFAHFREIQGGDGYRTLAENARVQFDVTQGAKGLQASNIRPIA